MKNSNVARKICAGGFTLLETLVAIAILLIAVVGPMSAIGGSLSQIGTARDQMIAFNLAQEGIEVVRQKRDSNMLNCWVNAISPCGTWGAGIEAGDYIVDSIVSPPLALCSSCTADKKLVRQNATGWHYQTASGSGGTATKFSRVVNIIDVVAGREKTITSTVTWSVGGVAKTAEVRESIFGINN